MRKEEIIFNILGAYYRQSNFFKCGQDLVQRKTGNVRTFHFLFFRPYKKHGCRVVEFIAAFVYSGRDLRVRGDVLISDGFQKSSIPCGAFRIHAEKFAEECCFAVLKVMQPFLMLLPCEFLLVDRRISFCTTAPVFFEFFSLFRHISNPL